MPIIRISKQAYDLLYDEAHQRRMKIIDYFDHVILDVYDPITDVRLARREHTVAARRVLQGRSPSR
jgi:hypothetical protein